MSHIKHPSHPSTSTAPTPSAASALPTAITAMATSPSGMPKKPTPTATHDEIAARAYQLYCNNGYQSGECSRNWFQAETDLQGQYAHS